MGKSECGKWYFSILCFYDSCQCALEQENSCKFTGAFCSCEFSPCWLSVQCCGHTGQTPDVSLCCLSKRKGSIDLKQTNDEEHIDADICWNKLKLVITHCWNNFGLTGLGGSRWLRLLWMLPISVWELERERPSKYGLKQNRTMQVFIWLLTFIDLDEVSRSLYNTVLYEQYYSVTLQLMMV